jgi:hypothetical protein
MSNEKISNEELNPPLRKGAVMPRFFLDERVGCIAIRDTHHPEFMCEHEGLDSELPDVVEFEMGKFINNEWVVPEDVTNSFREKCRLLNGA